MKILFFGDVVGGLGLKALSSFLPKIIKETNADFIIANGENVTNGRGISEKDYEALVEAGVDVITLGNHWHGKKQIDNYIDYADRLIRPLNVLNYDHGVGSAIFEADGIPIRVTNVLGHAFMKEEVASSYQSMNELLSEEENVPIHIVDFHAESTSEKAIFAHFYDGQVSAVIGTHTHVQTNDAIILKGGTGFLSDAGLCGLNDSVIGYDPKSAIAKIVFNQSGDFSLLDDETPCVCFVEIDVDPLTGKCTYIKPRKFIGGKESNGEAHN